MKVAELSRRSGVPLPTIKFYIREQLLPPGETTAKNQAEYTEEHLARLALIRSLRSEAGLSVQAIGRALRAADAAKRDFVVAAIDALQSKPVIEISERTAAFRRARDLVLEGCRARGWAVDADDRCVREAARALAVVARSNEFDLTGSLEPYYEIAERIAEYEIPSDWAPDTTPNEALRYAVLGTVLFEPFILALRRAAHVARSRSLSRRAQSKPPGQGRASS